VEPHAEANRYVASSVKFYLNRRGELSLDEAFGLLSVQKGR
jgi:hypothetical protein